MTAATVHAQVRYLNPEWKDRDERPFISSRESRRANTSRYDVAISDARALAQAGALDLDREGFVLVDYLSEVSDFRDAEAVKASYEREIVPLLQRLTGAREVHVTQHQTRTEDKPSFLGAYARYVHCDYPLHPQNDRERRLLTERGSDLAAEIDRLDYAWLNLWAPFDHVVEQNALTLIDATTVDVDDFHEYYFSDSASAGYAALPVHNPAHRFHYVSRMRPGEALVFKQFDSRAGKALVCPHTAFYDTAVGDGVPGRRSVEFRALCVF